MTSENVITYGLLNADPVDFTDQKKLISLHMTEMFNRTQSMFRYEGLPDSLPQRIIELYLQMRGFCGIASYEGTLYPFVGGLGGEPDPYYMPTLLTVANPALRWSKSLKINEDCVVIANDSMYAGLKPMYRKYATLMSENETTMHLTLINMRMAAIIDADNDSAAESALKYIDDLTKGKLGIIVDKSMMEGIHVNPTGNIGAALTNEIEFQQYLKASWFNELGLQANYNMKRESINSNEAQMNEDALLPLIDDMLRQRQIGLEKVNQMFGTDIRVEFNSSWENNETEIETTLDQEEKKTELMEAEIDAAEESDQKQEEPDQETEETEVKEVIEDET